MKVINIFGFMFEFFWCFLLIKALIIYFSLYSWVPWHEPDGLQFLKILIFYFPLLLLNGLLFVLISQWKKAGLVIITALLITIPVLIKPSLDGMVFYLGQLLCFMVTVGAITLTVKDVFRAFHPRAYGNE